ncbi:MAG: 50S ribosomal protein L35 [Bacteroidales bacterium]|nr:50S ribosomal protein L35 [Bacteroidales bacterium]
MPKVKTKCAAKKRFKISGSGKIMRKHAFKAHKLGHKSKRQKRNLTGFVEISKADRTNVMQSLGLK